MSGNLHVQTPLAFELTHGTQVFRTPAEASRLRMQLEATIRTSEQGQLEPGLLTSLAFAQATERGNQWLQRVAMHRQTDIA